MNSLEALSSLDRRCEPPLSGPMCDLLWADPLLEDVLGYRLSDKDYADVSMATSVDWLCVQSPPSTPVVHGAGLST